ncbi:MAG: tRNA (cytidine(34)-2'-O)-methyltransferase [Candidatus Caenarcaniphilales bacterium]|nr:tRNA (cytidine(34)-2'-O)-methyltransferase [Candidatus Caenarcaniphilales bacterium]
MLEVVLYQPEIPPNTGNIGRLCVSNDLKLHLIEPLGFSLTDKHLKRSGLDYWCFLDLQVHPDWKSFCRSKGSSDKFKLFSTKGQKTLWEAEFTEGDILVFGPETRGLPTEILSAMPEKVYRIPMYGTNHRSLNLATATGICIYEALRQIKL